MLKYETEKQIFFFKKKNLKKDRSKIELIFETRELGHEIRIIP
jgi:hypothetical protein